MKLVALALFAAFLGVTGSGDKASVRGGNLLVNGGFEGKDGGWNGRQKGVGAGWETICGGSHPEIFALDKRVRHSGKQAQRMTCAGYNYRWVEGGGYCFDLADGIERKHPAPTELGNQAIAQMTPAGAVLPGRKYLAKAWVKIEGLSEKWEWFRLGVYWLDASGRFISETREPESDKPNVGSHDWKLVGAASVAPPGASAAKVYLHHHFTHGTVWYDDVSLTDITDSP